MPAAASVSGALVTRCKDNQVARQQRAETSLEAQDQTTQYNVHTHTLKSKERTPSQTSVHHHGTMKSKD